MCGRIRFLVLLKGIRVDKKYLCLRKQNSFSAYGFASVMGVICLFAFRNAVLLLHSCKEIEALPDVVPIQCRRH
jgi:hypothetical protein